jgi:hypothetical protein
MLNDKRLAKGRRWFEYHCYEGEDSSDAELWHHTHQQVQVIRKYKVPDECDREVAPMYLIRFADGFEGDVFSDELVKSPSDFIRPDYIKDKVSVL